MKVALIGGTGFVGGYLVDALLDANHEPSVLVRPGSESKVRQPDSCRIISGEVADSDALRQLFDGMDAVIYNIGILRAFPGQGITFEKLHYEGAARAMDLARECGVSRFLLMSANGIRKRGTPYQHTKALAEEHLAASGLDYTIFRPSVIFGDPRGTMEIATQLYQDMIRVPLPGVGFHNGLVPGKSPVVMEPVKASITLERRGAATVHILDHDGHKTGKTLPVRNGVVQIDGARDKTCYYLVTFGG